MKNTSTLSLLVALGCLSSFPVVADEEAGTDIYEAEYDCLIEPGIVSDVGSSSRGVVDSLLVKRGDRVVADQPIVALESAAERTSLALAEAKASMRNEVDSREADLELARLDRQRIDDPRSRELTTEKLRDEADARERVARAALAQAKETSLLRDIELLGAQLDLAKRTIASPFDGVVVAELVSPGELMFDVPVMRIAQLDPLHVELILEGHLFGDVRVGDTGRVVPELAEDRAHDAVVTVVDPLIDAGSGTFGVRLELSNSLYDIVAGQRCRVSLAPVQTGDASSAH